ncbi:MAG: hypothetical protein WAT93_05860 [Pontixanthobacter sp.]
MFDTAGPHFALSELLIVLAAVICGTSFGKSKLRLAAAGALLFGAIAAIGAIRFGTGRVDAMADLHKNFTQSGGAIAMSLVAAQLALLGIFRAKNVQYWVYGAVAVSALTAICMPSATALIFIAWLIIAMASAAFLAADGPIERICRVLLVGIFLINLVAVRQSPWLTAGISWHLFHTLVAVWLVGLLWVFQRVHRGG